MQRSATERPLYRCRFNRFHPVALWLFWICIAVSIPEFGWSQQLHTHLDRDSVEVGEPFHLILVLQRDSNTEILSLPDEEHIATEEVHLLSRERFQPEETRDSLRFRLQYFGLQDTTLRSIPIHLLDESGDTLTLRTPEIPLYFRSVTEPEADFRPMKPLYEFARQIWPWLLALAIAGLIGYWLYRRLRTTEEPERSIPIPPQPFVDPLKELERSIQKSTSTPPSELIHNPTPSTVELGDAIRTYLERVYRIQALEMTSREILRDLREWPARDLVIRSLHDLFKLADQIKFARYQPSIEDIQNLRQAALQFLQIARTEDMERIQRLRADHTDELRTESDSADTRDRTEDHA